MSEQLQERILFDTRLVKRNLERGVLDGKTLVQHLEQLPDASAKAEPMTEQGGPALAEAPSTRKKSTRQKR